MIAISANEMMEAEKAKGKMETEIEKLKDEVEKLRSICASLCSVVKQHTPDVHARMLMRDISYPAEAHILVNCKDGKIMANIHLLKARTAWKSDLLGRGAAIDLPDYACSSVIDLLDYMCTGRVPEYLSRFDLARASDADRLYDLGAKFHLPGLCFSVEAFRIGGILHEIDTQIALISHQDVMLLPSPSFTIVLESMTTSHTIRSAIEKLRFDLSARFKQEVSYQYNRIAGDDDNIRVFFIKDEKASPADPVAAATRIICSIVHKIPPDVKAHIARARSKKQ
jgi:hypothetical protein